MKQFYLFLGLWAALMSVNAQQQANFDDLHLDPESYFNGSDGSGGFESDGFWFPNDFNFEYWSWSGFAVSNTTDTVTHDYQNQYSAITGGGSAGSDNYAVVYFPGSLKLQFDPPVEISGFDVTNSTYTYLTMKNGDQYGFSKIFGGVDGTDPDYLKLMIWGVDSSGNLTDTVEHYLADFRFENPDDDYIQKSWEWVELGLPGKITELHFGMESSDTGDYGMNTPAYFCMDNFTSGKLTDQMDALTINKEVLIFPNPVSGVFQVQVPEKTERLVMMDSSGKVLWQQNNVDGKSFTIDVLLGSSAGIYFLQGKSNGKGWTEKIIKREN